MSSTTTALAGLAIYAPPTDVERREALKRRLEEALNGGSLVRLASRCPLCAAPPKLRASDADRAFWKALDPSRFLFSYECARRDCGGVFPVFVRDFILAS
jgi:hypothetical protein